MVHALRRLCLRLLPPGPSSAQARYTAQLGCLAFGQVCSVSLQLFLHATVISRVLDVSVRLLHGGLGLSKPLCSSCTCGSNALRRWWTSRCQGKTLLEAYGCSYSGDGYC